jgi:UDP-N-acetylglucosamine 2-epimerase (non-hydrolysing)
MNRIMVLFGTRPEIIKLAPVIEAINRKRDLELIVGHTGQHYDLEMSQVFIEQLGLAQPDFNLNSGSGSHAVQTARLLVGCEKAINRYRPSVVVAEGDTNTVVAVGLASAKLQVPFAHVEAGLRSFDRGMPEEINRILADHCAELCLAPTEIAAANLVREAIYPRRIAVTGNTVVDSCLKYLPLASGLSTIRTRIEEWTNDFYLLTMHRAENVDSKNGLAQLMRLVRDLGIRIVYPVHPRTRLRLEEYGYWKCLRKQKNIFLLPPVGYWDFLWLLSHCRVVLTDSGGVQEEALTVGVPCVTLRENTERPETVICGCNFVTGLSFAKINAAIRRLERLPRSPPAKNPLGDGHAGQRIADLLAEDVRNPKAQHASFLSDGYATRYLISVVKPKQVVRLEEMITLAYDEFGRICFPGKGERMGGWSVELFGEPSRLRPHLKSRRRTKEEITTK